MSHEVLTSLAENTANTAPTRLHFAPCESEAARLERIRKQHYEVLKACNLHHHIETWLAYLDECNYGIPYQDNWLQEGGQQLLFVIGQTAPYSNLPATVTDELQQLVASAIPSV